MSTNGQGSYEIAGLTAPRYRVCFSDDGGTYLYECWNDKSSLEAGQDIPVTPGAAVTADAVLAPAGRISGRVSDAAGPGVANINVSIQQWTANMSYWSTVGSAQTESDGTYEVRRLRAGTYRVCFSDYGNTYVGECWNDKPTVQQAQDVQVAEGGVVGGLDAVLATEARISGTLTDASGAVVPNLNVSIRQKVAGSSSWDLVRNGQTDSSGRYEIGGLRAGTYRVCFDAYGTDFLSECWNDKPTRRAGRRTSRWRPGRA